MDNSMPSATGEKIGVFLEIGKKKVFAGAIDWPGWCRNGPDEQSALESLLAFGPRYAQALASPGIGFQPPQDLTAFTVVERVQGGSTTDFGVPDMPLSSDARLIDDGELQRYRSILAACWSAFDLACKTARGKQLRKGPRGGGRELPGIVEHVIGGNRAYLSKIGGKFQLGKGDLELELQRMMPTILDTLAAASRGELPKQGPRGGKNWTQRYFVRRTAWHILDHAWEIEDRIL